MGYLMLGATVLTAISGGMSATAQRKASRNLAKSNKKAQRQSLITAKKQILQNNYKSSEIQSEVFNNAGTKIANINKVAEQAIGSVVAETGGSGAVIGTGTTRENLRLMAQDALQAKLSVALGAKRDLDTIQRENKMNNQMIWDNAKYQSDSYGERADMIKKSADNQYTANIIGTVANTAGMASKVKLPANNVFNTIWHNMKHAEFDSSKNVSSIWSKKYNTNTSQSG